MVEKQIPSRLICKHDTEANWLKATNFIPKQGEPIVYDIDDDHDYERFKLGDGTTLVSELPFLTDELAAELAELAAEVVTGPTSAEANKVAVFSDTTGKVIKDGGYTIQEIINQNAFSEIKVAEKTETDIVLVEEVAAEDVTDTLVLAAGSNVTLTPDTTNKTIIIEAEDTTYEAAGTDFGLVKSGGDVTISDGIITVNDDSHAHTIANVDGLQEALDDKANFSHGTHVTYSTTAPVMDGDASVGSETTVARSDHKHPTDTSRAAQTDLESHTTDTSNPHKVTKEQVGLDKVDNTADADKSVKYATSATRDASNNVITTTYETKSDASNKLTEAKDYAEEKASSAQSAAEATAAADATSKADQALASAKAYADTKTSTHNTATDAHNDIRVLITELTTKLNHFLDVDDETKDELSEVLTLIENNKGTLESLTTSKVNVTDIIDNLTTNVSNKPLSAAQGVVLKALIDAITDTDTTYDLAASKSSTNGNVTLNLTAAGSGSGTDSVSIKGSGATTVTTDASGNIIVSSTDNNTDTNTTYDLAASKSSTNGNVKLNLTAGGSGSGTDSVSIKGSGATTVTTDASGNVIIDSTDTNTTYTAGTGLSLSTDGQFSAKLASTTSLGTIGDNNHIYAVGVGSAGTLCAKVPLATQSLDGLMALGDKVYIEVTLPEKIAYIDNALIELYNKPQILSGTSTPSDSLGNDGDIYVMY